MHAILRAHTLVVTFPRLITVKQMYARKVSLVLIKGIFVCVCVRKREV